MSETEIRNCAFRVLYRENHIAAEFFHSVTDGHGGMVVTATLVAEYLRLRYGLEIPASDFILGKPDNIQEETRDDYVRFAGKHGTVHKYPSSFQLPEASKANHKVQRTCYEYLVSEILMMAHEYGVSITTLLSAVMLQSVMEIQKKQPDRKKREQPVQIMVPVDLRRLFGSRTLRNFSLFALCGIRSGKEEILLKHLLRIVETQLNTQNTSQFMEKTMAGQLKAANFPVYKCLPLAVKMQVLKFVQEVWGESNSCISLSNLGVVSFPEIMEEQVEHVSFTLSPRRKSPYNCSVVSYKGKLSIMFSSRCKEKELEHIFSQKLETIIQKHYIDKSLT